VARQAKTLEAKLRIARGEADDDEDVAAGEEDGKEATELRWGAGKRAYYDADVADMEGSDEEEALADEEAEAVRLQREAAAALRPSDFGADDDSEEEGEEEDHDQELTLGARAAAVEAVPRELSALDDEARAAAVRQDALELGALVAELRTTLGEVRGRLGPLLQEVRKGELATSEGISYLEAKHTLLVHYAAAIVFYLLLKAEGRPVKDHPVVARLVEIRAYLEKVRPIDKRLQYQIEKLLAAAQRAKAAGIEDEMPNAVAEIGVSSHADAARFGPRPEALLVGNGVAGANKDFEAGPDGIYRPPRLNPVSMETEEDARAAKKVRRREEMAARRAGRSSLVQELAAEMTGAPEEIRGGAPLGMDTAAALRDRQRMAAREAVEEELMVRVPLTREERKRMKAQRRAGLSGKALLDDFADDVADLVGDGDIDPGFAHHRAGQKFGADLAAQAAAAARRAPRSGDADLPRREPLTERRARMDGVRARAAATLDDDGTDDDHAAIQRVEDEFYQASKAAASSKRQRRQETYKTSDLLPPVDDPSVRGARRINTAIEKNRGLTPHRRKDMKNPRKKHRVKFAEATVRRKGQVQGVREHEGMGYGGEATGIKSRVSKSVKF
jgi:U3 small nucleolar RNA-associated protein 3